MSREYKTLLVILAGGSVFVPLVLGLALGWPTWLWGPLIVVLLIVTAMVGRYYYEQHRWGDLYDHQWNGQPERSLYPQHPVADILLDSAEANYKFLFSGTVCWCSIHTAAGICPGYQKDLAVQEIRTRARDVTATHQPDDHVGVQNELAVALGTPRADPSDQVQAWAVNIALTIPDEDAQRLRKRSELRKQEQICEHEQAVERKMRNYLGQEVLKNPGSAVVWWLARHTDEVREAAALIGALTQLVAAANDTDVHEQFRRLVLEPDGHLSRGLFPAVSMNPALDLINQAFRESDDPQRTLLADDLAKLLDSHSVEHDWAERLRETFKLDMSDAPLPVAQSAPSDPLSVPAKPDSFELR